jgi:hypothetical protein
MPSSSLPVARLPIALVLSVGVSCAARVPAAPRPSGARASVALSRYVPPENTRRIARDWPRWLPSAARDRAERGCREWLEVPVEGGDGGASDGGWAVERVLASEWIDRYPLGPLSTGVGFGEHAIATWTSLAGSASAWRSDRYLSTLRRSRARNPQPSIRLLDGAVGCVSAELLGEAIRSRPLARCDPGVRTSVVLRAVVTRAGWLAPVEASVLPRDRALAECVAAALVGDVGIPHAEGVGVETVFAVQWW